MPRKFRLTKEQLAKEADTQLRENARALLTSWFKSTIKNVENGDNRTIEMVGRMFQFDKGPGGITIFNQHMNLNAANSGEAPARVRSFDQIVAKLEDRDNVARQIAAPLENSEEDDEFENDEDAEDIVEAEVEELPELTEAEA